MPLPYRSNMETYQVRKEFILARNWVGAAYTFKGGDDAPVDADDNGDKIVFAGTVVSLGSGEGLGFAYPHTSSHVNQTAVGVLVEDMNLRRGDEAATVLIEGWVDENYCVDLGVFGSVSAQVKTDLANRVHFTKRGL